MNLHREGDKEDDPSLAKGQKWNLTFVHPNRKCIHNKLEDAAMLNFKHVAETMSRFN